MTTLVLFDCVVCRNQKPIDSRFTVRNAHTETPKKLDPSFDTKQFFCITDMIFLVWGHTNYWEISQASETPNGLKAEINKYLWKTYGADTTVPWTYWSLARDENGRFKDGKREMDDFPAFFANLLRAECVSSYNFMEHPATLWLVKRSCAVGMSYVNCLFVWGNLEKESRFRPTSLLSFWSRRIQIGTVWMWNPPQHNMIEPCDVR